jgi:hypothetical protein
MMTDKFADLLCALPERPVYSRKELLTPQFKLAEEGRLTMYYAPFDSINAAAKLAIIGVTPGWTQMEMSCRIARRALLAGRSIQEAYREAKTEASFGGSMRSILVSMLDRLEVPKLLRLTSSHELFGIAGKQLHTTSAIRYPVFVGEHNYTGSAPVIMRSPLLMDYARRVLAPELSQLREAVFVPLGRAVESLLTVLELEQCIPAGRILRGFPHPSGANGHRVKQFTANREPLRKRLEAVLGSAETLISQWMCQEHFSRIREG